MEHSNVRMLKRLLQSPVPKRPKKRQKRPTTCVKLTCRSKGCARAGGVANKEEREGVFLGARPWALQLPERGKSDSGSTYNPT